MFPQKESFQMYECYCQNKPRSEALWRQFSDCAFFQVLIIHQQFWCRCKIGSRLISDVTLINVTFCLVYSHM